MNKYKVYNLVFSSSATVYGIQPKENLPLKESASLGPTNPYGRTKYFIEEILKDMCASDKNWNIIILRYFNPVGAHASGLIGEDPNGIPNNLLPYVTQVAVGKLTTVRVWGNSYPTIDGTGVRDYIHVVDLAAGHTASIDKFKEGHIGFQVYNLGTGIGYSVLQVIQAMEKASGKKIPYEIAAPRPGDVAENYANVDKANKELNWKTKYTLKEICEDAWRWQSKNPNGYKG